MNCVRNTFGYHFDTKRFTGILPVYAKSAGVAQTNDNVLSAVQHADVSIAAIMTGKQESRRLRVSLDLGICQIRHGRIFNPKVKITVDQPKVRTSSRAVSTPGSFEYYFIEDSGVAELMDDVISARLGIYLQSDPDTLLTDQRRK